MPHERAFRFGLQLATGASAEGWAEQAKRAEDLGFSSLLMPDHFGDQLAPVPALMAAADATTSLRIGTLVHDNDYKHPVVLAKESATLDLLSDGRLELGIGAGWMNTDYEQSGIPKDPAGVRIDRLEEALDVIEGLFGDGPFDFAGEHYTITGLDGLPKPVQKPRPPFMIGGGGKRVLSLAARRADIVGIAPRASTGAVDAEAAATGTGPETDKKLKWIRDAAGDRYSDIEINILLFAVVAADDPGPTYEMLAGIFGIDASEGPEVPHVLVGTTNSMCESLGARRERWDISYVICQGDALEAMTPVVAALAGT
jgi:probable F420-dependent oxidoreductase